MKFSIFLFLTTLKRSFIQISEKSLSSIWFVYWCRTPIFRSNGPFWRSNTALDGPLINQSNRLFLSGYTINFLMILFSETWSETEKLRTMMDTQTFIIDDHLGFQIKIGCHNRELKQTGARGGREAAVNKQFSIQRDSRPSEFIRPLTHHSLFN